LMQTHDIGVTWFECPEPDCDYKAKKKMLMIRVKNRRKV
jgi:hypothetical protein